MNSAFKNSLLIAAAAERTGVERSALPQGELLQSAEARAVEHVGAGQQDRLPRRQHSEADGAVGGLPAQGLQHRAGGTPAGYAAAGSAPRLNENRAPTDEGLLNVKTFHPGLK